MEGHTNQVNFLVYKNGSHVKLLYMNASGARKSYLNSITLLFITQPLVQWEFLKIRYTLFIKFRKLVGTENQRRGDGMFTVEERLRHREPGVRVPSLSVGMGAGRWMSPMTTGAGHHREVLPSHQC